MLRAAKRYASSLVMVTVIMAIGLNASNVHANQPPKIQNISAIIYAGYAWVIGTVTDPDTNPAGWTVTITGDLNGTTIVRPNGTFGYVQLYPGPYGSATATTVDSSGASSSPAYFDFTE